MRPRSRNCRKSRQVPATGSSTPTFSLPGPAGRPGPSRRRRCSCSPASRARRCACGSSPASPGGRRSRGRARRTRDGRRTGLPLGSVTFAVSVVASIGWIAAARERHRVAVDALARGERRQRLRPVGGLRRAGWCAAGSCAARLSRPGRRRPAPGTGRGWGSRPSPRPAVGRDGGWRWMITPRSRRTMIRWTPVCGPAPRL